ncbi:hypothetical protein [Salmonella phage SPTD1]|uniref:Uncharacterized protein n=13 Tax=Kuttervirus TaxID=2169536 RepID=G9II97_9CAUD|nr:hypothetical protein CBA120_gp007 [Escherichia phage Cba120]YP_007002647.1 hypothetical protein F371_gp203 [Escherichia phage PhaxI]YP_009293410.1 hypothetical protein BI092_gp169 [Salmonella phage vB-SalM-PM10]YP_009880273.1 hypothetical protein HYP60_gp134 [Escherichia phage EP75]YP_009883135.1 hypothetical protein HYP88_gp046 [Salmonella phage SS9]YP_009887692.1 hypothetical protein HYQ30_gp167 [Salmonella phage heyday]YP_009888288.1 hypothetical protein HYQ33_gp172 [Salmonella phage aa
MKSFQDFLEDSSAPATTTADVGKPEGGMVKEPVKKPKDLEEESDFKKIFGSIFKDLDLSKARKWNFRTGQYDD